VSSLVVHCSRYASLNCRCHVVRNALRNALSIKQSCGRHHYKLLILIGSFLLCRNQVQKIYPLNSNTPITSAQVQQILSVAKSNNLPTQRCCQQAQKFAQAKCACDTTLPPALASVGFQVTNVGLESADQFTSQACNFPPTSCSNSG
jgi:hypothetical protein